MGARGGRVDPLTGRHGSGAGAAADTGVDFVEDQARQLCRVVRRDQAEQFITVIRAGEKLSLMLAGAQGRTAAGLAADQGFAQQGLDLGAAFGRDRLHPWLAQPG